jgi:hypothetical protein
METDELWVELRAKRRDLDAARLDLEAAQVSFEAAREALVSRLCSCYRIDEKWEDRAVYCIQRMTNTCPYFLELRRSDT